MLQVQALSSTVDGTDGTVVSVNLSNTGFRAQNTPLMYPEAERHPSKQSL